MEPLLVPQEVERPSVAAQEMRTVPVVCLLPGCSPWRTQVIPFGSAAPVQIRDAIRCHFNRPALLAAALLS